MNSFHYLYVDSCVPFFLSIPYIIDSSEQKAACSSNMKHPHKGVRCDKKHTWKVRGDRMFAALSCTLKKGREALILKQIIVEMCRFWWYINPLDIKGIELS